MTACANPTCDREAADNWTGPTALYCSRLCQVAMLNNRGRWSVRVSMPASLAHRLRAFADDEEMSVEAFILMLIEDEITPLAAADRADPSAPASRA